MGWKLLAKAAPYLILLAVVAGIGAAGWQLRSQAADAEARASQAELKRVQAEHLAEKRAEEARLAATRVLEYRGTLKDLSERVADLAEKTEEWQRQFDAERAARRETADRLDRLADEYAASSPVTASTCPDAVGQLANALGPMLGPLTQGSGN